MGRKKGYTPSPGQIAAMQEGRRAARERKIAAGIPVRCGKHAPSVNPLGKPILCLTGKEKEAFDYYTPLRDIFRPLGLYNLLAKIIKEITDKTYWQNTKWIKSRLANHVTIKER
jgi:hypothetical protein